MKQIAASRSRNFVKRYLATILAIVLLAGMLQGCKHTTPSNLSGIRLLPGQTLILDNPLNFEVETSGLGFCLLSIDYGDGFKDTAIYDLLHPDDPNNMALLRHAFASWGDGKTVTATGGADCPGTARTRFAIPPLVYTFGFNSGSTLVCDFTTPPRPPLPARTLVHITTVPTTAPSADKIDFGCPFGCIYDPDGKPDSIAADPFPFPGLREFSLVLRVGTQVFQGGKDVRFTTTQAGPLEICLNDNNPADNFGGYTINIAVDQLGP